MIAFEIKEKETVLKEKETVLDCINYLLNEDYGTIQKKAVEHNNFFSLFFLKPKGFNDRFEVVRNHQWGIDARVLPMYKDKSIEELFIIFKDRTVIDIYCNPYDDTPINIKIKPNDEEIEQFLDYVRTKHPEAVDENDKFEEIFA